MNAQWLQQLLDTLLHPTMEPVETEELVLCFGEVEPTGTMFASIIDKQSGEIREQSVWCAERWPRGWRETAARRMRRDGRENATPQRCINTVPPEAKVEGAYKERGNRIARGEAA